MAMQRVLITGAGGGIGRSLRETLRGVYPVLRLSDRVALAPARDGEEIDRTEISDMAAVERMVEPLLSRRRPLFDRGPWRRGARR
jgi:uronate dehydrogenase